MKCVRLQQALAGIEIDFWSLCLNVNACHITEDALSQFLESASLLRI